MVTQIPARFRYFAFALVLASLYFVLVGAQEAIKSNTNNVLDWLPADFEETQRLIEFVRHFGAEEFLMVSWPDCGLDDERQARLAAELRKPAAQTSFFFDRVMTGREVMEQLGAAAGVVGRAGRPAIEGAADQSGRQDVQRRHVGGRSGSRRSASGRGVCLRVCGPRSRPVRGGHPPGGDDAGRRRHRRGQPIRAAAADHCVRSSPA